ncbi:unnamed protein product [Phytophthora lilii]|uniref:Unnamed protein product n=1 Tax=Phytophthora lilii TaxID=2077276 RepID=A0A9W6X4A3_9STRA|nr:unnamed protein product [Phytophthora lilii]
MEPDGFMYLEYAEKEEAEAAVAAVKKKTFGLAASTDTKFKPAVHPATITEMQAVLSLRRGEPKLEANEELKDLLLGRQLFSQSQQEQTMDEDDLILQSLSQHSFASSQQTKKKKKRRSSGEPSKKSKKSRSNRVAIPTE